MSLWTTALEFQITIILTPHLAPSALVFRTLKGYRYPRLTTPVLGYALFQTASYLAVTTTVKKPNMSKQSHCLQFAQC